MFRPSGRASVDEPLPADPRLSHDAFSVPSSSRGSSASTGANQQRMSYGAERRSSGAAFGDLEAGLPPQAPRHSHFDPRVSHSTVHSARNTVHSGGRPSGLPSGFDEPPFAPSFPHHDSQAFGQPQRAASHRASCQSSRQSSCHSSRHSSPAPAAFQPTSADFGAARPSSAGLGQRVSFAPAAAEHRRVSGSEELPRWSQHEPALSPPRDVPPRRVSLVMEPEEPHGRMSMAQRMSTARQQRMSAIAPALAAQFPDAEAEPVRCRHSCDVIDEQEEKVLQHAAQLGLDTSVLRGHIPAAVVDALLMKLTDDRLVQRETEELLVEGEARLAELRARAEGVQAKTQRAEEQARYQREQYELSSKEHKQKLQGEREHRQSYLRQTQEVSRRLDKIAVEVKRERMERDRLRAQLEKRR